MKPRKIIEKLYNWDECIDFLEKKYNFNHRDFAGSFKFMSEKMEPIYKDLGCNYKNYEKIPINIQQRAFAAYKEQFKHQEPEYQDFWHFITATQYPSSGQIHFDRDDLLELQDGDWKAKIIGYILKEFGGKNQECTFRVEN